MLGTMLEGISRRIPSKISEDVTKAVPREIPKGIPQGIIGGAPAPIPEKNPISLITRAALRSLTHSRENQIHLQRKSPSKDSLTYDMR